MAELNQRDDNNNLWVGSSPALKGMQQTLNTLAGSHLPVLITGQRGTGKGIAAQTIHNNNHNNNDSSGSSKPYVATCCRRWVADQAVKIMDKYWHEAQGGTLFLRNIDALGPADADRIKDYWLRNNTADNTVHLLASVSEINHLPTHRFHINHHFVDWLHYHCLTVELKSLAERAQDIKQLVEYYAATDQAIGSLTINPGAWVVLKSYVWPGNVKQLERCLAKLAVLENNGVICERVLYRYFPAMHQQRITLDPVQMNPIKINQSSNNGGNNGSSNGNSHNGSNGFAYFGVKSQSEGERQPNHLNYARGRCADYLPDEDEAEACITSEQSALTGHHPALDKAIKYLCNHYKKSFSMTELAAHACVSPSHLSFLFKRYLGQSFKQILLTLRIDEAVRLLNTHPHRQVTHICDDVGFSDLSFFERKFKSMVGVSPGAYRDQFGKSYQQ